MASSVGGQANETIMRPFTYNGTTASAIRTMASANGVQLDLGALGVGDSVSATGTRQLVSGGSQTTTYDVTRIADDVFGGYRYNCARTIAA